MRFEDLNIPEAVLQGIKAAGFTECTPVQEATLPDALAGKDVAAQSQTGTGKTAAFLIAVFSRMLMEQPPKSDPSPRALVIAPTRELVAQIHAEALVLGQFTGFRIIPVFGGIDYKKQRAALEQGADMIIGTPGRLIDYLKQNVYSLRKTDFLVIDEADRMFDMGFIRDLRFLLRRMRPYTERQSMLFSATLSYRVMELCYEYMNLPERVSVTPEQVTVQKVEQELYHVGKSEKPGLLLGILRREHAGRTLIFVNMKVTAERLVRLLTANGIGAAAITGDIQQKRRLSILAGFKAGAIPVLVASDVASRGLHIEGVTHVINYDLPQDSEDYVHRIGRTARAGAGGKAISFADEDYVYALEDIERYIKKKIPVVPVEDHLVVTEYKQPDEYRPGKRRFSSPARRQKKPSREHPHGGRRNKDEREGRGRRRRRKRTGAQGRPQAQRDPEQLKR